MERTALRPRPLPGRDPAADRPDEQDTGQPPPAARPRRLTSALCGLCAGLVVLLAGAGVGAAGAAVVGLSRIPAQQHRADGPPGTPAASGPASAAAPAPAAHDARPALGVEAVDDDAGPGARIVAVHVPGPGARAGLTAGDVLLAFDGTRIDSAAGLARAVARARPGEQVVLTVRHRGGYRQLTVTPAVVT
ncbi:PDZ domain-containing protein [Streptomyces thermodiastaticus]|uniref:PDZ domain-containing protein n=1 Tax=Streptomyces thermodiastaticus TaxID=44061 RepID=UPI001F193B31|nr:PDZ domain-containing protein [Streptomyces thermodiastaticus]MCE7549203.1 PDZ domain-containing protein [Streptomyces thermodiastaticus]